VAAHFEGIYKLAQDQTQIQSFNVATLASRAIASGTLGRDATQLKLDFETRNLYEWGPMISAMSAGALPLDIRGRAAFKGLVYGKMAKPSVRGTLDMTDFDSLLNLASLNERAANAGAGGSGQRKSSSRKIAIATQAPAPEAAPPRIHWDSLHLDVDYSPTLVSFQNGLLRRGTAQISFSGRSALQAGRFTDSNQFSLITAVENASFSDVQSLAGTNYPVSGALTSNANLSGTINDIRGDGHLLFTSGSLYGEPFKSLRADIDFLGAQAQAKNIALSQDGAQLTGTGAYNFDNKTFRFDVQGSNFDFAHLQRLQLHKLSLKGIADFEATGSGTLERPVVNAKLRIAQLVMNGERVGEITAEAVTVGDQLKLSARSKLVNADLHADGNVLLSGDFPGKLAVRFSKLDFDPLLRAYMGATPISGHSSANGSIDISGPLRHPSQWQIAGVIPEMSAEMEKIALKNEGPIVFGMQNQVAELKQFHIQGDATDFQASGTAQLTGERTLNGRAEGSLNLKLLQGFAPDMNSYGNTDLKMTMTGTLSKPSVSGQVTIAQGGVSYADLPNGLTDINGTLTFTENRLHIQTLTAHTGGGTLDLSGFIGYRAGLQFDITAKGKDIRLRYPPGISAGANADLRYSGTPQNALLSGDITITRFGVNPRFDFASYLARSKQSATATQVNPMLDNLRLDVHIVSTPELRVETSLAKITGDVDLRVRGTAALPSVLGKVNITEGDIFFSSTKYHLERGDITFTNPLRIEPVLNLEASARVREYDVTIGLHGSADNLSTSYRSDPPLSSADIIALLALGRTRDDTAPLGATPQTTQNLTETASNAVLGEALNAATSSRVQRLFGVSRIKIDPQVGGPENNPNARLTVEQQVNKNITLTYITNLAQSTQQIIQAEFTVNRSLSFVIVRDQNGVLGMDIRFRQRKR
jgi:translocation and assembly module TamB